MAARYRNALESEAPGVGRDLARLERIYHTRETNATINCVTVQLRLVACRRRCCIICACAVDTHDGEAESEAHERPAQLERHPDIGAWYFMPGAPQIPCEVWYAERLRNAVACVYM
jgi:hypothetical protein